MRLRRSVHHLMLPLDGGGGSGGAGVGNGRNDGDGSGKSNGQGNGHGHGNGVLVAARATPTVTAMEQVLAAMGAAAAGEAAARSVSLCYQQGAVALLRIAHLRASSASDWPPAARAYCCLLQFVVGALVSTLQLLQCVVGALAWQQ